MSLFLQTFGFSQHMFREQGRGICSVSRGHRQKRIGVAMTPWPTGPTRGEEANEIEIRHFNAL
jgi:hypothetical protein